MARERATIHASAVLVGARAVLIRGAAGAGKSSLALALIDAAAAGLLPLGRLVADDRAHIEPMHGRLLVRAVEALAGLIEVRGLGIRRLPFEPVAVVGLVVDLGALDAERVPQPAAGETALSGVVLRRLGITREGAPVHTVIAALRTPEASL